MKVKNGITLIILVLTIILALILVTATTLAVGNSIDNARLAAFANDLKEVQDAVKVYYMENDFFPTTADSTEALSQKAIFEIVSNKVIFKQDLSVNNDYNENENLGSFYKIDLNILGVEQTVRGTQENREPDDVYVVSYPSMNVYYLAGVKAKNNTYYSLSTRLTDVVKVVNEPPQYTNTEEQSAYGVTVKKLKKAWTNTLNMSIEAQMDSNEGLYIKLQGGSEIKINTITGQNIFLLDNFNEIYSQNSNSYLNTNIPDEDIKNFNSSVQDNKYLEIIKKNEDTGETIGTIKVNLSNYETTIPVKATDSVVESGEEYNTVTFKVHDDVSGVREVRYEYLKKYDERTGLPVLYYAGVDTFDPSYIKTRGKKAELYEDGTVKIQIPKEIEGIEIRVFDRAGNVSEKILQSNARNIWIGIEKVNISGEGIFSTATFRINLKSSHDLTEVIVSLSANGKDYTSTNLSNVSGKEISQEVNFSNVPIEDVAYVKVIAKNSNGDIETRLKKFDMTSLDDSEYAIPGEVVNENKPYKDANGDTATIPKGFEVSEDADEQTIETGLVVIAPDGSEFVWVPVPENELNLFAEQSGTYDENGNPNMRGKLWEFTKDGPNTGTEIPYSSTGYREPDVVTDYDNDINNLNTINTILGISLKNATDLKTLMQKEYNEIYNSVKEYHGFYIGRYETGDLSKDKVVSKKGNEDIGDQTWYTMYAKEKKYATQLTGTKIKSNMIYGSQWDATMRWFAKSKDSNVSTYPVNAQNGVNANYSGSIKPTGSVGAVNNIYDMAGNVYDWIAESNLNTYRVLRGFVYETDSSSWLAGNRRNVDSPYGHDARSSRLALYIPESNAIGGDEYVKSGLILHLDGLDNTKNGHNNSTNVWEDLSGNNNNGTIKGASWLNDGLYFDGVDDWVPIKELNYPEVSLEVVFKDNSIPDNSHHYMFCNMEQGGYGLGNNGSNGLVGQVCVNNEYQYLSIDNFDSTIKNTLTITSNGKESKLYLNGNLVKSIIVENGIISYPNNSTIMALGTNPESSTNIQLESYKGNIYSARMYNRVLTEQEVKNNYEIDKSRFGM